MATGIDAGRLVQIPPEDYNELLKAERALHDWLPYLDKMEDCGIDCQLMRESARMQLERIARFKQHFGPK